MSEFQLLQNPVSQKWVILAQRRSHRPDSSNGSVAKCPFCPQELSHEDVLYRLGDTEKWRVMVIPNAFPFAPIHELVIHSPDHDTDFLEFSAEHIEDILRVYRERYNAHKKKGQVYIFRNKGHEGGESLTHAHTQIAVVPGNMQLDIPRFVSTSLDLSPSEMLQTDHFVIFCPKTSQWPDEVWVAPKRQEKLFGEITDGEISDFSQLLQRLLILFTARHDGVFPYNFYFSPGKNWYFRLIPRTKTLGGFEVGTGVYINTQDPKETMSFIKTHFDSPDTKRILAEHRAEYHSSV